jgi:hypothetical protein
MEEIFKEIEWQQKISKAATGGLIHEEGKEEEYSKLSDHMRSRIEVADILRTSTAKVTIFGAAVS